MQRPSLISSLSLNLKFADDPLSHGDNYHGTTFHQLLDLVPVWMTQHGLDLSLRSSSWA